MDFTCEAGTRGDHMEDVSQQCLNNRCSLNQGTQLAIMLILMCFKYTLNYIHTVQWKKKLK